MNESSFIKSIHRYLPSDLLTWKINDTFAGGVPDAFYAGNGGLLFVEYKYRPKFPARGSSLMGFGLRPQQVEWLNNLKSRGINTAVMAGCQDLVLITSTYDTLLTVTKDQFIKQTDLTRKHAAEWIAKSCSEVNNVKETGRPRDPNSSSKFTAHLAS